MTKADITSQDGAEGIVNKIIAVENEEAKYRLVVAGLEQEANKLRAQLLDAMNGMQLKTLKHQTGLRVTVTETSKIKVLDQDEFIADLKEKKLVNFIQEIPQIIQPAHEEVNQSLFKAYFKTSAWKPTDFKGVEIIKDQHITIAQPK